MTDVNRREFLKSAGAASAAAVASTGFAQKLLSADAVAGDGIPPHRAMVPYGLHAYPHQISVEAGQAIRFHVSSTEAYRLSICRLGEEVDEPGSDEVLHEFPPTPPTPQAIHPGSYVQVKNALPEQAELSALTLECWVRDFSIKDTCGLITQFDLPQHCGLGLFALPDGGVGFYLGDGGRFTWKKMHSVPAVLKKLQWHHLAATWDGRHKSLWVDGVRVGNWKFSGPVRPGPAALRLAARGDWGEAARFFDGDIALPAIYGRALGEQELQQRTQQKGLVPAQGEAVLACWPLSEERGDHVADSGPDGRHGRIINHATWMVGGPSLDAAVPRYGNYDPQQDSQRGHGLRFASDDLYDCRWTATHAWTIPLAAKSGFYVGRFRYELNGSARVYHALFVVKRPKAVVRKPRVVLLAATNTYRAYTYKPFAEVPADLKFNDGDLRNSPGDPPAFSFYEGHQSGAVTYQLGLRMPSPNSGPYVTSMTNGLQHNYSHLARADRLTEVWLSKNGYEYDVITDSDLHQDSEALRGYRVLIINGHSEYWSVPAYESVRRFLEKDKGDVIVMSGNTMFWRVSFNPDGTVMECRKIDAPGNPIDPKFRAETWHSQDGQRGGLLRDCGRPAWKLLGLECLGWDGLVDSIGPFIADNTDHFLFQKPEPTGLKNGDRFGQAADGGFPRAGGHEFDVRVSTLIRLSQGPVPQGAAALEEPAGIDFLGHSIHQWAPNADIFDYYTRRLERTGDLGGEMIYWERPTGGRVFHAGVIAGGWVLSVDPKFQALMRNVLAHFKVERNK